MKLNKRLLLAILPITLISSSAASYIAYKSLKASTIELELKTLDTRLTELSTSFNQYHEYAKSYIYATLSSRKMQRYITDNNNYRELSQRSGFKQTLSQFNHQNSSYIALTITEPVNQGEFNTILDITRSDDPFAEPYKETQLLSREILTSGTIHQWEYIQTFDGRKLIVLSELVDTNTFEAPLATQTENSLAVQLAIEPNGFETLLNTFLADYPASVSINHSETIDDNITPSFEQKIFYGTGNEKDKYIQIVVDDTFYQDKLSFIKWNFIFLSALFIIAYTTMTIALIRRYIIRPISKLENDIVRVSDGKIENISHDALADDEINSLARSFSKLYGKLTNSYKTVTQMSERDALTGLCNLPYITKFSKNILNNANTTNEKVAFIYIDLDNFKFVNDQYGHHTGDELLKAFSKRLTAKFRSPREKENTTIAARLGGDEFCVIYQGDTSRESLNKIATRILSIFDNGFSFAAGHLPITASIGISMYPDDGTTVSELISAADSAMYAAKSSGKNQFSYYNHDLWVTMNRRQEIENALKNCSPNEEFELVYMPLVSVASASITGFETLVRWHSPTLGNVSPAEFVPIAESCGLFVKIDEWVIKNAFKQYSTLASLVGNSIKLSINLSSAQLNLNNLNSYIAQQADKYAIEPSCIQFEITETLNIEFNKQASVFLNTLISQGYKIAIDDFGNGYTSLLQLVEFPAKMIKFDKTFMDKTLDGDNRNMLKPLVELCHSQELEVTIEGVETKDQAIYLTALGCDFLQGYYFGKPINLISLNESIVACQQRLQDLSNEIPTQLTHAVNAPAQLTGSSEESSNKGKLSTKAG